MKENIIFIILLLAIIVILWGMRWRSYRATFQIEHFGWFKNVVGKIKTAFNPKPKPAPVGDGPNGGYKKDPWTNEWYDPNAHPDVNGRPVFRDEQGNVLEYGSAGYKEKMQELQDASTYLDSSIRKFRSMDIEINIMDEKVDLGGDFSRVMETNVRELVVATQRMADIARFHKTAYVYYPGGNAPPQYFPPRTGGEFIVTAQPTLNMLQALSTDVKNARWPLKEHTNYDNAVNQPIYIPPMPPRAKRNTANIPVSNNAPFPNGLPINSNCSQDKDCMWGCCDSGRCQGLDTCKSSYYKPIMEANRERLNKGGFAPMPERQVQANPSVIAAPFPYGGPINSSCKDDTGCMWGCCDSGKCQGSNTCKNPYYAGIMRNAGVV